MAQTQIILFLLTFIISCGNEKPTVEKMQKIETRDSLGGTFEKINEQSDAISINETLQKVQENLTPTSFIIRNPSQYSREFIEDFKKKHSQPKIETVVFIDDTIIINNDRSDLIIIPTDLPLNKKVKYVAQREHFSYKLIVKRINYTTYPLH